MGDDATDRGGGGIEASRREVLRGAGAFAGPAIVGARQRDGGRDEGDGPQYSLEQDGTCVPLIPLSGETPVEDFYDYRLPERYVSEANGASDPGEGPYYSSAGTDSLQRPATSVLFLYDGPEGLSLVVVHGTVTDDDEGGSVTFTVSSVPADAEWVVKDDYYEDPDTGEIANSNYDRWRTGGRAHEIDWTWGGKTDGGALRDLGDEFELEIDPAFNEDAALYEEHYEGDVEAWQALVGSQTGIDRVSLSMDEPVTVRSGGCDGEPLFEADVGDVSVRVTSDEVEVRAFGVWISVSDAGVDFDLQDGGD